MSSIKPLRVKANSDDLIFNEVVVVFSSSILLALLWKHTIKNRAAAAGLSLNIPQTVSFYSTTFHQGKALMF